jgi:type I restriction enzyme S subunit
VQEDGVCSTDILVFRVNEKITPEYLCYLCHTDHFVGHAKATTSGVQHPRTSWNSLSEFRLTLPPLDEQRRIAHVLTTVQTAIEQQAKLIDLTRELKSALMKKLFTEGLHGEKQKKTDIGFVSKSWNTTTIGAVTKLQSGGTPSRDNPKYWKNGTIPWVKTGEINYRVIETTEEFITEEGLNNSAAKILPKGTLLAAMYGQGVTRGRVGILGLDATANQACAAITPFDEKQIMTRFLYYYMQFHYQSLRDLGHGANQRNLNMDLIKSFPLSYPESDEQRIIVDTLLAFDNKLTLIEQKKQLLEELFRTLLHQLMTGQVRVKDLEI